MEWVVAAVAVVVALVVVAAMLLIMRDRRNRSLGEQHSQFYGDASHAESMGRAYAADVSRDTGIGSS